MLAVVENLKFYRIIPEPHKIRNTAWAVFLEPVQSPSLCLKLSRLGIVRAFLLVRLP